MISTKEFQKTIWAYYKKHGRHTLPWRLTRDPYRIWVSEIMLQQTQVSRVLPKYKSFLKKFPTLSLLAKADQTSLLKEWQGLGYNRRALNMKRSVELVLSTYKGKVPLVPETLEEFPGIGHYTARAIVTFSKDVPLSFIETNIRTVFVHFFFSDKKSIHDKDILAKVEETLPKKAFKEWYYALMDYGVLLKSTTGGKSLAKKSAHYVKQSAFKGSGREVRSTILREVLKRGTISERILPTLLPFPKDRITEKVAELIEEGFLKKKGKSIVVSE